jgi:putative peptidoglycan lipid II flippase
MTSPTDAPPSQKQPRQIEISQKMTVGHASWLMAAMIGLSRLTGFGRMMLVSHLYAKGPQAAVFEAAFNIPDTITILIAGGALATGFVPVFTEYLARGDQEAARRTFRAIWTLLGCAFGVISLVLFLLTFTPWGALLAPHKVAPEYIALYLELLRILLVAQFFFVVGGLFSGTLNALRLFWYPALQPVCFNLGIIVFGIILPWKFHMDIVSQAWGALVGAIIGSLIIQMPAVLRNGLTLQPLWDINDPGVRRVLRTLLPIVFGLASGQIIALNLPRFFATALPATELPAIGYANRLMQVPLDLLASGPAIALFPTLSLLWAQGKRNELRSQLSASLQRTIILILVATALLAALRFAVIHLLLEHGEFTKHDSLTTSPVLLCYTFCILGLGIQQVLARGYYAMGITRPPILIGLIAMAIFSVLGVLSMHFTRTGAVGLAFSAAIAVSIMAYLLWLGLNYRLGGLADAKLLQTLGKGVVAALATYFVTLFVQKHISAALQSHDLPTTAAAVRYSVRLIILVTGAMAGGA